MEHIYNPIDPVRIEKKMCPLSLSMKQLECACEATEGPEQRTYWVDISEELGWTFPGA